MYISRIYIRNYKNFEELDLFIPNGDPLTIIGRNGAGKTNLLSAIRLVLDYSLPVWDKQFKEVDFCWNQNDQPWILGEEIVITITFSGVVSNLEVRALLESIAPAQSDGKQDQDEPLSLEANLSFVYAPVTYNKETNYDLIEDYLGFHVAGRYHPSGSYYTIEGRKVDYDDDIIKKKHFAKSKKEFYKHFYLAVEDLAKIETRPDNTFEKKIGRSNTGKARRHLNVLFLDALRDVKKDFHTGYNSIVSQLIRASAKKAESLRIGDEITDAMKYIRDSSSIPKAQEVFDDIEIRLAEDKVSFLPDNNQLVLGTPKITMENIGRYYNFLVDLSDEKRSSEELEVVGLGNQNLAYISSIFALFELKKELYLTKSEDDPIRIIYNLLLIEEPEAHLDVQNQKRLHTQIERKTTAFHNTEELEIQAEEAKNSNFQAFTQVIQTSHSTHLTSKSDLKNIIVIEKDTKTARAININSILKSNSEKYEHNRRILRQYLDATRSSLLFAKKVILVEGLSEKYALSSILNFFFLNSATSNGQRDVDGEGIEIVEVGGKNFEPFAALYQPNSDVGLKTKCLVLCDGDIQLKNVPITNYASEHEILNNSGLAESKSSTFLKLSNIITFEVDTFFIPNPRDISKDNVDFLKWILLRLHLDGLYYSQPGKLKEKFEVIDAMKKNIIAGAITKDSVQKFFQEILYKEVSKPTISLYLASLLKTKATKDESEIEAWKKNVPDDVAIISFDKLQTFVTPNYIETGIKWLISE
jgi:putative ATP-dependent endonuclease of the OLD family